MDTNSLKHTLVELPGRAGEIQRRGDADALLIELGDNYERYHQFLAAELAKAPSPDPKEFRGDGAENVGDADAYARAADRFQRILSSELTLRRAGVHRRQRRSLSDPLLDHPPLIDADTKLVNAEHPDHARFVRPPAYQRLGEKPKLPDG